jgi:tetrahydromethanopterin S-methyltransferase subunit B
MVEMLPLIKIAPEYNLTLDPSTGSVGAALGREVIVVSMDEINDQITALEEAATELVNSLDPTTTPIDSYPGREGAYITQGLITNIAYGFLVGLLVLFAALPLLQKVGVL